MKIIKLLLSARNLLFPKREKHLFEENYSNYHGYRLNGYSNDYILYLLHTFPGLFRSDEVEAMIKLFKGRKMSLNNLILSSSFDENAKVSVIREQLDDKIRPTKQTIDVALRILKFGDCNFSSYDFIQLFGWIGLYIRKGVGDKKTFVGHEILVELLHNCNLLFHVHLELTKFLCDWSEKGIFTEPILKIVWSNVEKSVAVLEKDMNLQTKEEYMTLLKNYYNKFSPEFFAAMAV